jgi:hypothetical protein
MVAAASDRAGNLTSNLNVTGTVTAAGPGRSPRSATPMLRKMCHFLRLTPTVASAEVN